MGLGGSCCPRIQEVCLQGREASARLARDLLTGAAGKYGPLLYLRAGTAPKQQTLQGSGSLWGMRPQLQTPLPPLIFLPSFPSSPLASTPSPPHPDPSLASYPDMLFPLRSLRPAKSHVSFHFGLRADALISLARQSPLPVWLLLSQPGRPWRLNSMVGRGAARTWGVGVVGSYGTPGSLCPGLLPAPAHPPVPAPGPCGELAAFLDG